MPKATDLSEAPERGADRIIWLVALAGLLAFVTYKLHDIGEPFAFGHLRWTDAYVYWFARAHIDFGLGVTHGLNVEGVTGSGLPIFFLSHPPLTGLVQAAIVHLLGGEFWTVRPLALFSNLLNAGLIASLAHRLIGARAAPLAILLFLGMPFIIEYGSNNESFQAYAMSFGLGGYLFYLRFLTNQHWSAFVLALACFGLGMGFTWLADFMALAMLCHLWLQPMKLSRKVRATLLAGALLGSAALLLLMQQGMATGDFLYPFTRALERSSTQHSDVVTWTELGTLQLTRYWNYYGPVTTGLSVYWLLRRLLPRPEWRVVDGWAVLTWVPGVVYGFLLRDAAYRHDFLMLGLVPGATLMATLGLMQVLHDITRLSQQRSRQLLAWSAVALLLSLHAAGAMRSAMNFDHQKALDLQNGAARMAFHLHALPANTLLAADPTARIGLRHDDLDGADYVSIPPFLDYYVRRPVHAVDDLDALGKLTCDAARTGRPVVLLQTSTIRNQSSLEVPKDWVTAVHRFDRTYAVHLLPAPFAKCASARLPMPAKAAPFR